MGRFKRFICRTNCQDSDLLNEELNEKVEEELSLLEESDGKKVKVIVTVEGIEKEQEVCVVLEKEKSEEAEEGIKKEAITEDHRAEFSVSPGGYCKVYGKEVSGYISPRPVRIRLGQFHGVFQKEATLTYESGDIEVLGVELNKNEMYLLKGFSEQLKATIIPGNANNMNVRWESGNTNVAKVDEVGNVLAAGSGQTRIIVVTEECCESAICNITVAEIEEFENFQEKTVSKGEVVILPNNVKATLNRELAKSKDGKQFISYDLEGKKELIGDVQGTDKKVELLINVKEGEAVIKVQDIKLDKETMELFVGEKGELIATVTPENANINGIIWTTNNASVATVTPVAQIENILKATIEAKGKGTAIINIKTLDQEIVASCIVVVAEDSTPLPDDVYIVATNEILNEKVDMFNTREEVFIRGFNLEKDKKYYVKVEQPGKDKLLGEGTVTFNSNEYTGKEVIFNLLEVTEFKKTNKNCKQYFVYMSTDSSFPKGDDEDGKPKTVKTNFKVESPVPTGAIQVNVKQLVNGQLIIPTDDFVGKDVILCRELDDKLIEDICYEDYLNPLYGRTEEWIPEKLRNNRYNDEVKLTGTIQSDGTVKWFEPKETLKIGGYILLMELPDGYITTLNLINPDSDDGALLKEVHIRRDEVENREIIVMMSTESKTSFEIYGTIKDNNGEKIAEGKIELVYDDKVLKFTTTKKDGAYSFNISENLKK